MKIMIKAWAAVVLFAVAASSAQAALYDWRYAFGNGVTVTGMLSGTLGGDQDTITVSDVFGVAVDGTPYPGALFPVSVTSALGGGPALPVVSISGDLMDLCGDTVGDCTGDGFYFDTQYGFGALVDLPSGAAGADEPVFLASAWSIQAVPEPHVLALVGMCLAMTAAASRRRRAAPSARA